MQPHGTEPTSRRAPSADSLLTRMLSFRSKTPIVRAVESTGGMLSGRTSNPGQSPGDSLKAGSEISPAAAPVAISRTLSHDLNVTALLPINFASLTREQMLLMTAAEREALLAELCKLGTRLQGEEVCSPLKLERLKELKSILAEIRNEAGSRRLFEIIENVSGDAKNAELSAALCLNTESVIPSNTLFEALLNRIPASDAGSLQGSLRFCCNWLAHNQTTALFAQAAEQFSRILAILEQHPDATVQTLIKEIRNKLEAPPASPPLAYAQA